MPEKRRRKKTEFVGYEHAECECCTHAIYRDVLNERGNPTWETYEVSDFLLMLERSNMTSLEKMHRIHQNIDWLENALDEPLLPRTVSIVRGRS